jgi:hypothetical protein
MKEEEWPGVPEERYYSLMKRIKQMTGLIRNDTFRDPWKKNGCNSKYN